MKKNLLIAILFFCSCKLLQAQAFNTLSATVNPWVSDMCNMNVGKVFVDVQGGVPPYTYLWNTGATTDTLTGLAGGPYDVTVTDNTGTSVAPIGAWLASPAIPDLNVNQITLPTPGASNGSIDFFVYSFGMQLPNATYNFTMTDSALNVVYSQTETCVSCGNPLFEYASGLAAGSYHLTVDVSFGCSAYIDFTLHDMPTLAPTLVTTPSCLGAPDGNILVNTHPNPVLDSAVFLIPVDIEAHPPAGIGFCLNTYRGIVYNSSNAIVDFKIMSDSIFQSSVLTPGNYTLKIYERGDNYSPFTIYDSVLVYTSAFTITSNSSCSLVTGNLFADYNNDCIKNGIDLALKGTQIELNPGSHIGVTDIAGIFFVAVPAGTYTLKQYAPYQHVQLCPDTNTYTVTVTQGQIVNIAVADSITGNPDVQIGLSAISQPRPGFNQNYVITYKNLTPYYIEPATVTFNYDPLLQFIGATPAYTTSSAGQITWNVDTLPPFGEVYFYVNTNVPNLTAVGTVLNASASVPQVTNESVVSNNSNSISQTVTASVDPNEKEVSPVGYGSDGYITNTENLQYTIRFQNTGNDTAFTIAVYDTLPQSLDVHTLQVLTSSHDYSYEIKSPDVVIFHFDNILLPDSGTNEEASHGMIKFSVAQLPNNVAGTVMQNKADIVFDFNAPVATNEVKNTIFDCDSMADINFSDTVICSGNGFTAWVNTLFPMSMTWYIDSVFFSNSVLISTGFFTPGPHEIKLEVSNPTCTQEFTQIMIVNPLPPKPTLSQNLNTISSTASYGNQWFLNGNIIFGATQSSYLATTSGYYFVVVTDSNGCGILSDSLFVIINGITENDFINHISILPNPASNFIIIQNNFVSPAILNLQIRDVTGKIIHTQKLYSASTQIDINNFAKGVYVIEISAENKKGFFKLLKE